MLSPILANPLSKVLPQFPSHSSFATFPNDLQSLFIPISHISDTLRSCSIFPKLGGFQCSPIYLHINAPMWHLISACTVYISMHSLGTVPISLLPSSLCPFWTRTITIQYCSISKSRTNERVYYLTICRRLYDRSEV